MRKKTKCNKLIFASLSISPILLAATAISFVPYISNNNPTSNIQFNNDDIIQTEAIKHSSDLQVVNNAAQLNTNSLQIGEESSSVIVNNDGIQEFYVWGRNNHGQLGLGDFTDRVTPTKLDLSQFGAYLDIKINIADFGSKTQTSPKYVSYAIVTRVDRQDLYVWGLNTDGQLGLGDNVDKSTPTLVDPKLLNNFDTINSIAGGRDGRTLYIITTKNNAQELFATGNNDNGQLADGTINNSNTFKLIPKTSLGNYSSIIKFNSDGNTISTIVKLPDDTNKLYVWGDNQYGQLGLGAGNTQDQMIPVVHTNAIFESDTLIRGDLSFSKSSYFLDRKANKLYVWGKNNSGQLGLGNINNTSIPTELLVTANPAIIKNVNIDWCSYAIVNEFGYDRIYVWGANDSGQLGVKTTDTNQTTPTVFSLGLIGTPSLIIEFNLPSETINQFSSSSALVQTDTGKQLYGWGFNNFRQLGVTTATVDVPINLAAPNNLNIVNASVGNNTKFLTTTDPVNPDPSKPDERIVGGIYAFGRNDYGQLGLGNKTNYSSPRQTLITNETQPMPYNKTYNLSAADAYYSFTDRLNAVDFNKLSQYVDFASFPENSNISVDTNKTIFDSQAGTLTIEITTNQYYVLFDNTIKLGKKSYLCTISGFLKVSDVPIITILNPNLDDKQFYISAITNNVVNRSFLEQYLNLNCIPLDAQLTIEPMDTNSSNQIEFKLISNKYYENNGVTTNGEYSQIFTFPIKTGLDPFIIIGIIAGSSFALILIFVIIYMSIRKYRYIKTII